MFLVDWFSSLTGLVWLEFNGRINYADKNPIKKWFPTFKIYVDCFPNLWVAVDIALEIGLDNLCTTTTIRYSTIGSIDEPLPEQVLCYIVPN